MRETTPDGKSRSGDQGLAARVLREALATPALREVLRAQLRELGRGEGGEAIRTLLAEDPELGLSLVSALPSLVDQLLGSLEELGRELRAVPPQLLSAYLGAMWRELQERVPPARLAAAINGLAWMVVEVERQGSNPASGAVGSGSGAASSGAAGSGAGGEPFLSGLVRGIDHGRLREGLVAMSSLCRRSLSPLATRWLADPVAAANLALVLPEVANDLLRLLATLINGLALPDEVLASATFNLLRRLDPEAVAAPVNALAGKIGALHRGSAILGYEEPAFGEVIVELLDGLLEALDVAALVEALVALAEDGDLLARVAARRIFSEPALLSEVVRLVGRLLAVATDTCREVLSELEQVPEATLEELGARLDRPDPVALAELINRSLRLASVWGRGLGGGGGLGAWVRHLLAELDGDLLGEAAWHLAEPVLRAWVAAASQSLLERPQELGRDARGLLARFNAFVEEDPVRACEMVERFAVEVGVGELARAMRNLGRMLGGGLLAGAHGGSLWEALGWLTWRGRGSTSEGSTSEGSRWG